MVTEILAELDAAIAEADSTTDDLCAQFLADALEGVWGGMAGAIGDAYCDALDCHGGGPAHYRCEYTLARWRAPEAEEPLTHGPGRQRIVWATLEQADGVAVWAWNEVDWPQAAGEPGGWARRSVRALGDHRSQGGVPRPHHR